MRQLANPLAVNPLQPRAIKDGASLLHMVKVEARLDLLNAEDLVFAPG